jgi:FKBP-type peptidyl-prolyl cis-trans isomerase 2
VRKLPALIAVTALLATLTACSTSTAPGSAGCTAPASGNASSVVSATGKFGEKPKVTIPTPVNTNRTQVSTLLKGDGQILTDGTPALIEYTIYSGTTGKVVSSSSYSDPTTPVTVGATKGGPLIDALECSRVGSRIAVAVKASELDSSTTAKPTRSSGPAYIAVIDIVKAYLPKANGALQTGVNNMPAVVTAANGAPGVSIPDIAAPTKEKVQLVRKGSGATLTKSDTAIVQYTAVDWAAAPTVQGSTWTDGDSAVTVALGSSDIPAQIRSALIGQKVGSQVLVVIPPTAASGSSTTYVYVFDVLGAL